MKKNICFITSTRADYGLLKPVMELFKNDNKYELQIVATGMHLSQEFGETYTEIENDGFDIRDKIEILLSSDTSIGTAKSMGLAMISFSEAINRLKPDVLVVLGDRYEIFAMCSVAVVMRVPIVHLYGGETTEGAFDEVFRHSITKMSYLHFTSTEEYRKRVIQLGENPKRVFNVGSLGVENVLNYKLLSKKQLEDEINFKLNMPYGLVTYHPVTLEDKSSERNTIELLNALDEVKDMKFILTKSNSDNDGRIINKLIDDFANSNKDRIKAFTSMGNIRYLSAMKYSACVIGNSSSGIIEAPSFNVRTINIGDRQKGRIQANSIINVKEDKESIKNGIKKVLLQKQTNVINPYKKENTSRIIYENIDKMLCSKINLKKKFYDI
ncbi:MAG: UDP-N-acetylglucosamine 2-epimerase (hydrolyzing) [Clostridium sp.]|nr:UDP-N-acetylglucosamine 2-epimerase (hydrolyzing) [Clostridium sp.]